LRPLLFSQLFFSFESLGWKINSDDLDYIPAHWLAYKAPEPIVNYILGTIYVFFTLASLTGNGLVIWIFSTCVSSFFIPECMLHCM
jgi:hypothetical protein